MRPEPYRKNHELGVFALLIEEHRRVAMLFESIDVLADADARNTVFETLARELLAHARAEQAIVYVRLERSRELEHEMERARDQHVRVELLVDEIRKLDPDGPTWTRKVEELRRAVEAHVEEEEREIIPRAHLVIDDNTINDLEVAYKQEKLIELEQLDRRH